MTESPAALRYLGPGLRISLEEAAATQLSCCLLLRSNTLAVAGGSEECSSWVWCPPQRLSGESCGSRLVHPRRAGGTMGLDGGRGVLLRISRA